MSSWWQYLLVFASGGLICALGQILILRTKMTSARILVLFLLIGVFLQGINVFDFLSEFALAGIKTPIIGFGASLAKGATQGVKSFGIIGAFTGGMTQVAAGLSFAIVCSFVVAILFKSKTKK